MALADQMSIETKTEEEDIPTIIKAETADGAGDVNCVSAINFKDSFLIIVEEDTKNRKSIPYTSFLVNAKAIAINIFNDDPN